MHRTAPSPRRVGVWIDRRARARGRKIQMQRGLAGEMQCWSAAAITAHKCLREKAKTDRPTQRGAFSGTCSIAPPFPPPGLGLVRLVDRKLLTRQSASLRRVLI